MTHEFLKYLRVYAENSFLIEENKEDKDFFCLLDGMVTIWKGNTQDREKMMQVGELVEKGTYFGEMGYLLQEKRSASIIAKTQVKVLKFPGDMLPELIMRQPNLGLKLSTALASRLKGTTVQQQTVTLQRDELRSDATDQLLHAKDTFQKVFMMLTAIQAQFQNPMLKSIIDYLQRNKLMQGGRRMMVNEIFLRDIPSNLKDLVKKTFESS